MPSGRTIRASRVIVLNDSARESYLFDTGAASHNVSCLPWLSVPRMRGLLHSENGRKSLTQGFVVGRAEPPPGAVQPIMRGARRKKLREGASYPPHAHHKSQNWLTCAGNTPLSDRFESGRPG